MSIDTCGIRDSPSREDVQHESLSRLRKLSEVIADKRHELALSPYPETMVELQNEIRDLEMRAVLIMRERSEAGSIGRKLDVLEAMVERVEGS